MWRKRRDQRFVLWFSELDIDDVPLVGGKNASLGEMYQNLTKKGVRVPNGFAITSFSYNYLLEKAGVKDEIKKTRHNTKVADKYYKIVPLHIPYPLIIFFINITPIISSIPPTKRIIVPAVVEKKSRILLL